MKNKIIPNFIEKLSNIIKITTNGEYTNIKLNENEGLIVELENGDNVTIERLSIGTIYQIYLGLRIAVLEEMQKEKVPIILDEPFVYFDQIRLENILKYINENLKENQIIILTCAKREIEILNKMNINYKLVNLIEKSE